MTDDLRIRLLVVDDEQSIRRLCMTIGNSLGFVCDEAESAETAASRLETEPPDLVLSDFKLPNQSGVELLKTIKGVLPRTEVAIMTGHGSIESAVDAMKLGAYDYIEKPFRVEKMRLLLQRMAEKVRLVNENAFLRDKVNTEENLDGIIGASAGMQDVLRMISRLKDTRTPVLISGESGTGKELVARAIHFRGPLAKSNFVAVDCGALVPTLMESELFGYEKGAFTGATKTKAGLFQAANGGTIFLDEIGDISLSVQTKLLRVIQEKKVTRIGSARERAVDVRIIAATHKELSLEVQSGNFREDLYYRLNVLEMRVPPLRERMEDIPELARHLVDKIALRLNYKGLSVGDDFLHSLQSYSWPGNIRELENVIERAIIRARGAGVLHADLLDAKISNLLGDDKKVSTLVVADIRRLTQIEREAVSEALTSCRGNILKASAQLGIGRNTLYRKIRKYNLF
jgi:two-component system, NtrC family, response regulator AtoC